VVATAPKAPNTVAYLIVLEDRHEPDDIRQIRPSLPSAVFIDEAERMTDAPEKQQPRIVLHAIPNGKFNILVIDPEKDPRIARPIFPDMTDIEIREFCRSRWPAHYSEVDLDELLRKARQQLEERRSRGT